MRCPIRIGTTIIISRARIGSLILRHHGDAAFNGAYHRAEIAADTFLFLDNEFALAINLIGDRLMGCIFANLMTTAA